MKNSVISWILPLLMSKVVKGSKSGKNPLMNQLFLFMALRKMLPLPLLALLFILKPKISSLLKNTKSTHKI